MSSTFTAEQENAITASGSFVIVSAAAGSGKTTVLIEKLIRMLSDTENRVRADSLIVVTFTRDAAGQILRRLRKALNTAVFSCKDEEKKSWLKKQQVYLNTAKISTISSFCFDLIRAYGDKLGVSPDFRIIDEQEGRLLLIRALEETADKMLSDENTRAAADRIFSFFGYYTRNISDKNEKYGELLGFRDFLLSVPFYKERFTDVFLNEYKKGDSSRFDPFESFYGKYFYESCISRITDRKMRIAVNTVYGYWKDILEDGSFPDKLKSRAMGYFTSTAPAVVKLHRFFENTDRIDKLPPPARWDRYISVTDFSGALFRSDLKAKTKNDTIKAVCAAAELEKGAAEDISEAFEYMTLTVSALPDIIPVKCARIREDYKKQYERLSDLMLFMGELNKRFEEIKAEKNGLVFSDGEQLALKLLGKPAGDKIEKTEIAEKLSKDFSIIMIDEFQDSNNLQDCIFRLLSPCGDSENAGKNIFAVGDIKQSIYNFRLADPQIFYKYLMTSEEYDPAQPSEEPRRILLNKNFRSGKELIDFVNFVFGEIMTENSGGVKYDDTQKLIYSGEVWEKGNSGLKAVIGDCETEILLVDKSNTPFDAAAIYDADKDVPEVRIEAEAVALKIYELLETHPELSYRDICILCPTNADLPFFAEALGKLGIRSGLENRNEYIASREISTALNILKILDDPHNNTALAGVLLSPVYMFTAEDMAELSLLRNGRSYYSTVRGIAEGEETTRISGLCVNFIRSYDRMKSTAAVSDLENTVRSIYRETGLTELMSLYPDGETRRANLNLLPYYVRMYESGAACGTGGIYGFIRYISDASANRKTDYSSAALSSESDNAVAIKTVHRSKGLEYPIVFVCRCDKDMAAQNDKMNFSTNYGAAFTETDEKSRISYEPLPFQVIRSEKKKELLSEKVRLMYVAATRAKHKLYICGTLGFYTKKNPPVRREGAVYAEGKYGSFRCDVTNCSPDDFISGIYGGMCDKNVFDGDSVNGAALMSHSSRMLYWVIAALMNKGVVPYFDPAGKHKEDNNVKVKVNIIRADHELTKLLSASDKKAGAKKLKDTVPDAAFLKELEQLKEYDSAECFASRREKQARVSKLTVTEILHNTSEADTEPVYIKLLPDKNEFSLQAQDGFSEKLTASERGTAVHAFMQYADLNALCAAIRDGADDPVGDEAQRLYLDGMIEERAAGYITESKKIKQRVISFFGSPLWTDIISDPSSGQIIHEQPFLAKFSDFFDKNSAHPLDIKLKTYYNNYDDTFVQGIADLIIKQDGGFILVDYKTNEGKDQNELTKMYGLQLMLYTRIFERIYGFPEGAGKAYIYSFGIDGGCFFKI